MAKKAANCSSGSATARILVGADDVGLKKIVSRFHLAFAEARAPLKLTLFGKRALHGAAVHRTVAIDHREASRLLYEDLDNCLGAAKVQLAPPFLVGWDDRKCSNAVRTLRNFRFAPCLILPARAWVGKRCR